MVAPFINRMIVASLGAGLGALILTYIWGPQDLLRLYTVHYAGAMVMLSLIVLISIKLRPNLNNYQVILGAFFIALGPFLNLYLQGPQGEILSFLLPQLACIATFIRPSFRSNRTSAVHYLLGSTPLVIAFYTFFVIGASPPARIEPSLPERSDPKPTTPDVLLISIDTLRADIFDDPLIKKDLTVMQRMAQEGLRAPYAISSSSLTLPGHASMLTGLDSMEHGIRDNFDPVPPNLPWLANYFQEAGYHTAGVISNGLLSRDIGFGEGFEIYDDSEVPLRGDIRKLVNAISKMSWLGMAFEERKLLKALDWPLFRGYRTNRQAKERGRGKRTNLHALKFAELLLERDRPYFFFLHYMDPHDPYGTIAPYDLCLEENDANINIVQTDPNHGIMGETIEAIEKNLNSRERQWALQGLDKAQVDFTKRRYAEEMLFMDKCLLEIIGHIEKASRPTIIILTSDHGEHFGEHGLMLHGNSLFKENLRVPFFMMGPGVPSKTLLKQPVHLIDIAPTLLSLCGIESEQNYRGQNILDIANRHTILPRQHLAVDGERLAIMSGNQKLIGVFSETGEIIFPKGFGLFDINEDPNEENPNKNIDQRFLNAIEALLERDQYNVDAQKSDFQADMGNQLGYTGE